MTWYIEIYKQSNGDVFDMHSVLQTKLGVEDKPVMILSYTQDSSVVCVECYVPKKLSFSAKEWLEYIATKSIVPIKVDDSCLYIELETEYPEKEVEAKKSLAVQFLTLQGIIEIESDDEFVYDEW